MNPYQAVLTLSALSLSCAGVLSAQQHPSREQPDSERTIAASSVPDVVKNAFRRAFPNAVARRYTTELHNGKQIYEVEGREGGKGIDVGISAEGAIIEVETEIPADQLPAQVRASAQANHAVIERAERVVSGRDTTWEIKVRGRTGEMRMRTNGQPATTP